MIMRTKNTATFRGVEPFNNKWIFSQSRITVSDVEPWKQRLELWSWNYIKWEICVSEIENPFFLFPLKLNTQQNRQDISTDSCLSSPAMYRLPHSLSSPPASPVIHISLIFQHQGFSSYRLPVLAAFSVQLAFTKKERK